MDMHTISDGSDENADKCISKKIRCVRFEKVHGQANGYDTAAEDVQNAFQL